MPEFDLTKHLAGESGEGYGIVLRSLAARLSAMEIAVERFGIPADSRISPPVLAGGTNYWACRSVSDSDLTLTEANGEDWDAMIGDSEKSGIEYDVPTVSGWLWLPDASSDHHRTAAITFHNSGAAYTAQAILVSSATSEYVQVSVNGSIEEIEVNASTFVHTIAIEVKEGENRIAVSCKSGLGSVEIRTRFMDPSFNDWTDPAGE